MSVCDLDQLHGVLARGLTQFRWQALHSSQFPEFCFSWHRYQQTLSASLCGATDYGWNGDDCYQQSSNKCFSCSCDKLFHSRLPESFAQRCLKSVASVSGRIHLSDTLPWTAVSGREPTFEHFFNSILILWTFFCTGGQATSTARNLWGVQWVQKSIPLKNSQNSSRQMACFAWCQEQQQSRATTPRVPDGQDSLVRF